MHGCSASGKSGISAGVEPGSFPVSIACFTSSSVFSLTLTALVTERAEMPRRSTASDCATFRKFAEGCFSPPEPLGAARGCRAGAAASRSTVNVVTGWLASWAHGIALPRSRSSPQLGAATRNGSAIGQRDDGKDPHAQDSPRRSRDRGGEAPEARSEAGRRRHRDRSSPRAGARARATSRRPGKKARIRHGRRASSGAAR